MTAALHIVDYERKYREEILSLMFFSRHTHTHLDWYKAGQWLDIQGNVIQLAFHEDTLIGVMGVAQPLNQTVWLRLIIVAHGFDPALILSLLWEHMRVQLLRAGIHTASVLVINPWLASFLPALGFGYSEDVVTMHRAPQDLSPLPATSVTLQNGYIEHIHQIITIDHAAFKPSWQMSAIDLRLAQRQAASCTIAVLQGEVVGYEIATRHHTSGHLARLAVHPTMQGQRVGQLLLHNLLSRFTKRGVRGVTVNTQKTNIRSQRLYRRFGFIRNGFDIPVWQLRLIS